MSDKKLSINLITYNQPKDVKEVLDSILHQITDEVEIIVNDNSDNFDTQNLVKNEFSQIKYFKNDDERTIDTNILNAISRSSGEYVWIIGDDKLEDGAINKILELIKTGKYNYIFTNFHINEQDIPAVQLNTDEICENGNLVLEKVSNALGFVSTNVIKKDCLMNMDINELKKYIGGFINFYIIIHALSIKGMSYLCSFPYVHASAVLAKNQTEKYKKDAFKCFAVDTPEILYLFKNKFDKKSIKKMLAKNFGHIWRGMLVGIVNNRDVQKEHLKMIIKYYWNFPEFWIALPFLLMPRSMNMFFYKIYQKIKERNIISSLTKVPWF